MNLTGWYKKRITVFFILCSFSVIMLASILKLDFGQIRNSKYNVYSIEFDYYGVDSNRIEEIITIPLEEKIIELEGLVELRSSSEYNKSYVSAYFNKTTNNKELYLSIRTIVDNLYNNLPQDVQKPRIYSSSANDKSILSLSITSNKELNDVRSWADTTLKKQLEGVDGVSEIIVSGGSQKEIAVSFDVEKTVGAGQNPVAFSSIIQDGNGVSPGGILKSQTKNESIAFDTKLNTLDEIRNLPVKIGEGYTKLEYLAEIKESHRTKDEYVRINGNECICINIKSASNGNSIKISKECKSILNSYKNTDYVIDVLYDNGEEQLKVLRSVLIALIQSFFFILLIVPFFYNNKRVTLMVLISMLLDILWTLGLLQLLGITVNQNTISGITISLGLISDPVLIIGELAESSNNENDYFVSVSKTSISLIAASLTTILVLIPLFFLEPIIPGIKTIALTMLVMIINSIIISIAFIPSFIYSAKTNLSIISLKFQKKINRIMYRSCYFGTYRLNKIGNKAAILYVVLLVCPFFMFVFNGKNITLDNQSAVVYCSVDYEPEFRANYIDQSLNDFIAQVSKLETVKYVRSECRKGSADIDIGYYDNKTNYQSISSTIEQFSNLITDGYLYVPGASQKKSKKHLELEIAVIGDEEKKCREYAEEASELLVEYNIAASSVLNFKRPEIQYSFFPDRDKLIKNDLSVQNLSSSLRWMTFGPVADKWLQDGIEQDIRIAGKNMQNTSLDRINNLHVNSGNSYVILPSLGTIRQNSSSGKLYRKDGRSAAFFTIEINGLSTDKALERTKEILSRLELEKGYGFSFPQEITTLNHDYRMLVYSLIICILGIIILLTALTEKPVKALVLISIIPVSCFLPILLRLITNTPFVLGDVVGLVILSGISVNNSIYIGESLKTRVAFKLRDKIKSIFVTSLTTMIGCVPLYIFCKDVFSKSLAFFMFFGVLNSFLVCLGVFCWVYKKVLCSNKSK